MAIPDYVKERFDRLLAAARDGHLAVLEGTCTATGETRYILCSVYKGKQAVDEVNMYPLGQIAHEEDPFSAYTPPT